MKVEILVVKSTGELPETAVDLFAVGLDEASALQAQRADCSIHMGDEEITSQKNGRSEPGRLDASLTYEIQAH